MREGLAVESGARRHARPIRGRRIAKVTLIAAATACMVGIPAGPASANHSGDAIIHVTVHSIAGARLSTRAITGSDCFNNDVDIANQYTTFAYPLFDASGYYSGMSLKKLAEVAYVDPAQVVSVTLSDDAASVTDTVDGANVRGGFKTAIFNPSDSPQPNEALIRCDGAVGPGSFFIYQRPMGFNGERNGRYQIDTNVVAASPSAEDLFVSITASGLLLNVGPIAATPSAPAVTASVHFVEPSVRLPDGTPVASPTYVWDFGDGSPAGSGPAPTHAYAAAGRFVVSVKASDAAGNAGTSPPSTVPVGSGPGGGATTGTATGSTSSAPKSPPTGGGTAPATGTSSGAAHGPAGSLPAPGSVGSTPSASAQPSGTLALATGGGGTDHSNVPMGTGVRGSGTSRPVGVATQTTGTPVTGARGQGGSRSSQPRPISKRAIGAGLPAPSGLEGVVIEPAADRLPLSALSAEASPRLLTAARASAGGHQTSGGWIGWMAEGAALVIVVSLGAALEHGPRRRRPRLAVS